MNITSRKGTKLGEAFVIGLMDGIRSVKYEAIHESGLLPRSISVTPGRVDPSAYLRVWLDGRLVTFDLSLLEWMAFERDGKSPLQSRL